MYKWVVKMTLLIDNTDGVFGPDAIKSKYIINADNFSEALMEAYNDMVNSESVDYTGRITNCTIKQIGRN